MTRTRRGRLVRLAIAQAAPVFLDGPRTVAKAVALTGAAGRRGVSVLAFPETFVPGYPFFVDEGVFGRFDHAPSKEAWRLLLANSIEIPSAATRALGAAARRARCAVAIGVNERSGRSVFNALLVFDAAGRLAVHHRKLVPTHGERLVWKPGDARGLVLADTAAGPLGGLVCWEHWMPAPRQALHDAGERVHAALWPQVRDAHALASRHYAFEGRAFVLAAGAVLRRSDLRGGVDWSTLAPHAPDPILAGGSVIYGPRGAVLAGPAGDEETLLVADADPDDADREAIDLDAAGHYSRPDLFRLEIDRGREDRVTRRGEAAPPSSGGRSRKRRGVRRARSRRASRRPRRR